MIGLQKRYSVRPIWLSLTLAFFAVFSFGTVACAASCDGVGCSELSQGETPSDKSAPIHKSSGHEQMACAAFCGLCANIIPNRVTVAITPEMQSPLYFASFESQSSHYIAPAIPPPRAFGHI